MNALTRAFTPAEAAVLGGLELKAVNNAIDKRIVEVPVQASRRRELTAENVLQLKLWHEIGPILSQERRQRLFGLIRENPSARTIRADNLVIVDVAEARKQISQRTKDLAEAEAMVAKFRDTLGGKPVFKDTRIPVRLVAAMRAQGADDVEILSGYPKLTARQLELADIWSAAHPRRGRPKSLADRGLKAKSSRRAKRGSDPLSHI
ncbi:MAG: hypothetical protein BGP16_18215 [Sphingobium sp. 66-54]|nr:MAG: hypothetical protein BGP16_18215 [Sphingobium sp. 66-54]